MFEIPYSSIKASTIRGNKQLSITSNPITSDPGGTSDSILLFLTLLLALLKQIICHPSLFCPNNTPSISLVLLRQTSCQSKKPFFKGIYSNNLLRGCADHQAQEKRIQNQDDSERGRFFQGHARGRGGIDSRCQVSVQPLYFQKPKLGQMVGNQRSRS